MKINLKDKHSPCHQCWIHGHSYSPEDDRCQRCEYAITMNILRSACKILAGGCGYCRHYTEGCAAPEGKCEWHIDWDRAVKVFNVETVEE